MVNIAFSLVSCTAPRTRVSSSSLYTFTQPVSFLECCFILFLPLNFYSCDALISTFLFSFLFRVVYGKTRITNIHTMFIYINPSLIFIFPFLFLCCKEQISIAITTVSRLTINSKTYSIISIINTFYQCYNRILCI